MEKGREKMAEQVAPVAVAGPVMPIKIAGAVLKTQADLGVLGKEDRNPFGNYNFVSIDKYYELVASAATRNGLSWFCQELGSSLSQVPTKKDGVSVTVAKFEYMFTMFHVSGEAVPVYDRISIYHPMQGAQTSGSAASYAEKLFMRKAFKVVTGEKDADATDGDQFIVSDDDLDMDIGSTMDPAPTDSAGQSRERSPEPSDPEPSNDDLDMGEAEAPLEEEPVTGEDAGGLGTEPVTAPEAEAPAPQETPTLDPKAYAAPDGDGTMLLHEIKDPDKANWLIVKEVFETFIPDCKDKEELKSFWNKNTKALGVFKEHAPKALVKIFKDTHHKLPDTKE
jgi:hypothetical protein